MTKQKKKNTKTGKKFLIVVVIIITFQCFTYFCNNYEKFNTVARYHLINDIKNGDIQAIKYSEEHYGTSNISELENILY